MGTGSSYNSREYDTNSAATEFPHVQVKDEVIEVILYKYYCGFRSGMFLP